MTLYTVICMTDQNNPWLEIITEFKCIADFECADQQRKGIKSIVVEKQLNQYPGKRREQG